MRCGKWFIGLIAAGVLAQAPPSQDEPKQRIKTVHELGQGGSESIPRIAPYLSDQEVDVRREAVKAIVEIGTQHSLDPLIQATSDRDPEIQIRATDGLVNFYLPGYVKTGLTATLHTVGTALKGKFTDTNDQVVDAYIQPRPEVVLALGKIVRGGANLEARANAARAVGVLRGRDAIPDLEFALRSKETALIYESLVALQKIRDPSAGPSIAFLLHDLDKKTQVAAVEATGLLANRGALNDLRDVLEHGHSLEVRRAALTSIAQMPDPGMHPVFAAYLNDKDEGLREGAAEGIARLHQPSDLAAAEGAFTNEKKTGARLSFAFALVALGKHGMGEFDPLRYLVDNLNSVAYRGTARPYLAELARDPEIRRALYPALQQPAVTKDEKIGLAWVFARSGADDSIAALKNLSQDSDSEVSEEALRALKNLRAQTP